MAEPLKTTPCKGCGKPVVFVRDAAGKTQILDPRAPCWIVDANGIAQRVQNAMVTHFATCSKANDFSKKGGSQ